MDFDIAIIGAGIAGASTAWALLEAAPTLRVALIEMEEQPGYHTTGRSAAMFIESYGGPGVVPLSKASRGFFGAPPAGFQPLLTHRPSLTIEGPADPGGLARVAAEHDASGVPYQALDAAALAATPAGPLLKPEWSQRALMEPDCHDIDVAALHQGFLRGVGGARPTVLTNAEVTGLDRQGGIWRIATRAGELTAPLLVNAAGAWADGVAALAGAAPLGLMPLRRTMAVLRIDPPPPADMPTVMSSDGRFYFKPDGDRLWLSPHDEIPDVPHDVRPDEMDLAIVIDRFEQATNVQVKRLESSWAGLRTFAPDRLPVFGFDGAVDGLFWCAGQGGFGIQTAPAAGRLCAALLLGGTPPLDPAPYAATRAGIGTNP
ncbi:NAD(P)/FAD-dependent oxidoreductase [Sandarakinorhabdus oryzae]|uniref:NAD(P)/FAD-dependent oxidoreductase n=1 Tax=Sandarakinorhabdus oryzae TaxID=2675220 RepID=UPI0012E148C7|nr:FAD-binding oxidoreductase [Sandarakinorhabdus oryzae]